MGDVLCVCAIVTYDCVSCMDDLREGDTTLGKSTLRCGMSKALALDLLYGLYAPPHMSNLTQVRDSNLASTLQRSASPCAPSFWDCEVESRTPGKVVRLLVIADSVW